MKWNFLEQLTYCVLHGWKGLPERPLSDLDIVMAPRDFFSFLRALLDSQGVRLINFVQYESTCYSFIVDDGEGYFIGIDLAKDYRWDGRFWFSAEELLKGRWHWKGFWVAAPEVEFKYLLVKKLLKQKLPSHAADRLRELAGELGSKADETCRRLLGQAWGSRVSAWIREGFWGELEVHLPTLKRVLKWERLKQDPLNLLRYWLPDLRRRWLRWRDPTGLWVAVLGPDGSGKTSVLHALKGRLEGAFRRVWTYHFRPRNGAGGVPVTEPHAQPPRSWPLSLAKLVLYLVDYVAGYWLRVRPALVRFNLIFFDRYYHDLLVDSRRYRYGGPMGLARFVGRLVPKPDLFIVLDLPAEVAHARKPEVELNEAHRLRQRYLELAREVGAHVVDASRPLDEVVREVEEIILAHMERRTRVRLERLFPDLKGSDG